MKIELTNSEMGLSIGPRKSNVLHGAYTARASCEIAFPSHFGHVFATGDFDCRRIAQETPSGGCHHQYSSLLGCTCVDRLLLQLHTCARCTESLWPILMPKPSHSRSTAGTPKEHGVAIFRLADALFSARGENAVCPSRLSLFL